MKRLMIATAAATALLAGATAANAQVYYDGGYYAPGPYVERGVGLQIGPVGVGVYAPGPTYYGYGYSDPVYRYGWRGDHPNSSYNMRVFRAQEWTPQSPPGGGY